MVDYQNDDIQKLRREEIKVFRKEQKNKFLNRSRGITNENVDISVEKMKELNDELKKLRFKEANAEKRLSLLSQIRIGTCFGEDYIEPCLHGDVMHSIIHSLKLLKHSQCQLEAAACLTNFTVGSHQITKKVASKCGPFLIEFISCSNPQLQVQCAWAVTNICNDCEACFLTLKQHGLISSLLGQLESPCPEVVEYVMISLIACTRYNHLEHSSIVKLTNHLVPILKPDLISQPCHKLALYILSNIYPEIIGIESRTFGKEIFNISLQCFINAVSEKELDVQIATPCIRCFGIATAFSNDFCVTLATNKVFGSCVFKVLKCRCCYLKKELLWVLINIFASPSVDIEMPDFFVDLQPLIHYIVPFICPLDEKIFMAMHLLCTLLSKDEKYKQFVDDTLCAQVQMLKQYNQKYLENVVHVFNMLTGNKTSHQKKF